jgi:hypothetical protein
MTLVSRDGDCPQRGLSLSSEGCRPSPSATGTISAARRRWTLRTITIVLFAGCALPGCSSTEVYYTPGDRMITIKDTRRFFEIGHTYIAWNHDDLYSILLSGGPGRYDSEGVKMYSIFGPLSVLSGSIDVDPEAGKIVIDITLNGLSDENSRVPLEFSCNGTYRYREQDLAEVPRKRWESDLKKGEFVPYIRH